MKRYDELIILRLDGLNSTIKTEAHPNNSSTLDGSQINDYENTSIPTSEMEVVQMNITSNLIDNITTKMDINSENVQNNRSKRSSRNKMIGCQIQTVS